MVVVLSKCLPPDNVNSKCIQSDHDEPLIFVSFDGIPQTTIPVNYIPQLEAECELLQTQSILFISCGQKVTVVFKYNRSSTFVCKLLKEVADFVTAPRNIKCSKRKSELLIEAQTLAKNAVLVGVYALVHVCKYQVEQEKEGDFNTYKVIMNLDVPTPSVIISECTLIHIHVSQETGH